MHLRLMTPSFVTVAVALMLLFGRGSTIAQTYPQKPIRIVTAPIGGALDLAARLIAPGLTESLGQQAIVENRGGILGIEVTAKARPDGYTLLVHGSVTWLLPFMRDKVPWDPLRDFSPITLASRAPNILVVHPSLPVSSIKELIALAKARPGELNYGSGSSGVITHLAGELFKMMTRTDIVRIAYGGTGPALNGMITGEVHMMFPAALSAAPHIKAGRLRALAVTTAQPSALAPGLPTVAASGLPGFESGATTAVLAPAQTSEFIVNRLNHDIVGFLNKAEVKERLFRSGMEVVGSSPVEFAATIRSEMIKWGKVIKDAGIRDE